MRYAPWGEPRFSSGNLGTDYKFTGQREEVSFGLYFYNARWYDPAIGRFAQADSIVPGGVQGYDRYAYANNNPVKYTDPSGHVATNNDDGNYDAEYVRQRQDALKCQGGNDTYCSYGELHPVETVVSIVGGLIFAGLLAGAFAPVAETAAVETVATQVPTTIGQMFEGAGSIADDALVAIHPATADASIMAEGLSPMASETGEGLTYVARMGDISNLNLANAAEGLGVNVPKWTAQAVTLWQVVGNVDKIEPYFGPGLRSISQWVSSVPLPAIPFPQIFP